MSDLPEIIHLPIDQLQPNPQQPRGVMHQDELNDLVGSVMAHGILEPLVIAHTPVGYQIIAGERRWRAAKIAGLKTVPCVIRETTPAGMLQMALVENVQRVNLNCLDRAKAIARLLNDFRLRVDDVAERIGKSSSYVSNSVRLLDLPDAIKDGILSGAITEGHARCLSSIKDVKQMIEVYKQVLKEGASVRRTEELVRLKRMVTGKDYKFLSERSRYLVTPEILKWQEKLQNSFAEKAKVQLARSSRQTRLIIILKGTPEDTQEDLNKILKIAK